jgi:hypothetical protein
MEHGSVVGEGMDKERSIDLDAAYFADYMMR